MQLFEQGLLESIGVCRKLILAAEPPFGPPYEYMNVDRPLTSLKFEPEPCVRPTRMAALRHALYMLENAERSLQSCTNRPPVYTETILLAVYGTVACVTGILWVHGIEAPAVEDMSKAA